MTLPERTVAVGPVRVYRIDEPRLRRLIQVVPGLMLFGAAMGLTIEASLGVDPWTVFHDGLGQRLGLSVGVVTVLVGLAILVVFPLLDEPLGIGTLLNTLIVGASIDLTTWLVPDLDALGWRIAALAVAPAVLGLGSGLYLGAGLGPGPRDGVMTALERRGVPVWAGRTAIEVTVVAVGWLLGGDVGIGTIWMATSVGWFVHLFYRHPLRID